MDKTVFEGPAAFPEVAAAMSRSGLEPAGFVAQYYQTSGLAPRSALGIEFSYLIHSLWLQAVVDRLDCYRLASAEHLARRVLQVQKAVRRNPRSHDFENLTEYMRHAADATGTVSALVFDRHVADRQRDEAQVMKQTRLAREENDEDKKRKRGPKGGGKNEKNEKTDP